MSDVINKSNLRKFVLSANTPEYPASDWLHNPAGLATLRNAGIPPRHWKLTSSGDDIEQMTAAEKIIADAEQSGWTVESGITVEEWQSEHGGDPVLTARRLASTAADGREGYPLRAILRVMMQEMNELRAHVQLLKSELQKVTSHGNQRTRMSDNVPNIGNKTFPPFKTKYKNAIQQVDE